MVVTPATVTEADSVEVSLYRCSYTYIFICSTLRFRYGCREAYLAFGIIFISESKPKNVLKM